MEAYPIPVLARAAEDIYPRVPNPCVVLIKELMSKGVLTKFEALERYPEVANPATVERRVEANCVEEM